MRTIPVLTTTAMFVGMTMPAAALTVPNRTPPCRPEVIGQMEIPVTPGKKPQWIYLPESSYLASIINFSTIDGQPPDEEFPWDSGITPKPDFYLRMAERWDGVSLFWDLTHHERFVRLKVWGRRRVTIQVDYQMARACPLNLMRRWKEPKVREPTTTDG